MNQEVKPMHSIPLSPLLQSVPSGLCLASLSDNSEVGQINPVCPTEKNIYPKKPKKEKTSRNANSWVE